MPGTVIYDANVLYPNTLRDLLIRLARAGVVRAHWTEQILDEMTIALRRTRTDIDQAKTDRLRKLMNAAVRDCLVTEYEDLPERVTASGVILLGVAEDEHAQASEISGWRSPITGSTASGRWSPEESNLCRPSTSSPSRTRRRKGAASFLPCRAARCARTQS